MTRRSPHRAFASPLAVLLLAVLSVPAALAAGLQPPRYTRPQMEAAIPGSPPFTFVYGTRDPNATAILRARAQALATRLFGLDSTRVLADRDATEARLAAGPVYLVGGPGENDWTRRLAPALPVSFEAKGFRWQGRLYDQPLEAIHLSWPNPLEPRWFLILAAGNSPAALARRGGFAFGDEDFRILRDGELLRSGRFAQTPARAWAYDAALDRDREAERERYEKALRSVVTAGVRLRSPPGLAAAAPTGVAASALLARMDASGWTVPAGSTITLTLHRDLESKGLQTRDTHAEQLERSAEGVAVQAALPAGRTELDLWSVAAARMVQCGASPDSRFLRAAGVHVTNRFEGEPLARAISRLQQGGCLPSAAEAAARDGAVWRSPLVREPARALLVRAMWECAPAASRRSALLALLRADPAGTLDSLCRNSGVPARAVEARYRVLADSLAREGQRLAARTPREPWRPSQGFQRGVCLEHSVGLERGYLSAEAARQLARIHDAGADWVSLTPFAWLADPREPVLGNSSDFGPDGESDEAVAEAAARAHALGLRVWLKPHVWTRGWAGDLAFGASGWTRFFTAYQEVLLHWALLAEREGIDGLFIGHELASATAASPARWRDLAGSVRRVYGGLVSYNANWDEAARVPFWDALDVIAVSFYSPLAEKRTRDERALRRGADRAVATLAPLARRYGRPVLIAELGYAPSPDAPLRPWEEPAAATDPEMQRACLAAAVAALDAPEWLAGAFFWKWGSAAEGRDPFDPRGRPAEAVVKGALQGWQGRPVRVPRAEAPAAGKPSGGAAR